MNIWEGSAGVDVPRVDSLCPTFRWNGLSKGETYDFAIWDAIKESNMVGGRSNRLVHTPGVQIYHREGLKETSHKPNISLLPLKVYYWSVKLSSDEQWTKFNWTTFSGGLKYSLFLFETPLTAKQ